MAKIIIEFGEDEINDARVAIDGHKYKMLIWELDQKLRSVHKYGSRSYKVMDKQQKLKWMSAIA
jgi:hypothetical protein